MSKWETSTWVVEEEYNAFHTHGSQEGESKKGTIIFPLLYSAQIFF